MIIVTKAGRAGLLKRFCGIESAMPLMLCLYIDGVEGFVEPGASGYAPKPIPASAWSFDADAETLTMAEQSFTFMQSGVKLAGWCARWIDTGTVALFEPFPEGPIDIAAFGDRIGITITLEPLNVLMQ